jgi:uncharacterized caspase-like protein
MRDCGAAYLGLLLIAFVSAQTLPIQRAHAQDRVALVIGNGAYSGITKLANPANDATDMAAALRDLKFKVILATDASKAVFDQKLQEFSGALRSARIAVFFYAGHGMQVDGRNYLVPVDARLQTEGDFKAQTVDVEQALSLMQSNPSRVNLVFLDACRDNPLTRKLVQVLPDSRAVTVGRGLAPVGRGAGSADAGRGILIAFATAPDKVALDGSGRNSPFTASLLRHIRTPGLDIALVMRRVTADVEAVTAGRQSPWVHASLTVDVPLVPAATPGDSGVTKPQDKCFILNGERFCE